MTRIGVFSDSHGDRDALERLLEEMGHVDAACFLGDISSDAIFLREKLEEMPHQPVLYAVRGNNDLASMLPDQLLIELGGHKIWMEHGHLVPNLMTLAFRAKDHGADIALFGHTHIQHMEERNDITLLNPGTAGRFGRSGYAVVEITDGTFTCRLETDTE